MPKVAVVKYKEYFTNSDYGTNTIVPDSITEWCEVSAEDLQILLLGY